MLRVQLVHVPPFKRTLHGQEDKMSESILSNETEHPNTTAQPKQLYQTEIDDFRTKVEYIQFYLFAIVLWSGLLFNILAIICFLTSKTLKRATTGHYLIALASADSIFLVGDILRWLNTYIADEPYTGLTFHDDYEFWCKIPYYLRYFGKLASAWITVAITIERYISVSYPLRAGQISTKRTARIIIISTYICCAVLTLFPFWTIGLISYEDNLGMWEYCNYLKPYEYKIWNWSINWAGSLFIPSLILFVFTTMIIIRLYNMNKERQNLMGQNNKIKPIEKQLTIMLIVVVVAFLLLRLPYTIFYYLWTFKYEIWNPVGKSLHRGLFTAFKLTDVLASSNYATNFYLYCIAGSSFRGQFIALLCCRTKQLTQDHKTSVTPAVTLSTSLRSLNKLTPIMHKKVMC